MIDLPQIKRKLPRKVNHNTLKIILEYLEERNHILVGIKGICWIKNDSPKLAAAIKKGISFENLSKFSK